MNHALHIAASGAALCAALCGCGGATTGAIPESGYNTERVSYEPLPNPDAVTFEIPSVHPLELPEDPLPLPEPHVWTPKMAMDFVGEIRRPPNSDGWIVRVEISPILSDGALARPEANQVIARPQERGGNFQYLINWRAPSKPGRYHVAVQTVGPSVDIENMDTFAEGDVEVR